MKNTLENIFLDVQKKLDEINDISLLEKLQIKSVKGVLVDLLKILQKENLDTNELDKKYKSFIVKLIKLIEKDSLNFHKEEWNTFINKMNSLKGKISSDSSVMGRRNFLKTVGKAAAGVGIMGKQTFGKVTALNVDIPDTYLESLREVLHSSKNNQPTNSLSLIYILDNTSPDKLNISSVGTAVFLNQRGFFLTANHVVQRIVNSQNNPKENYIGIIYNPFYGIASKIYILDNDNLNDIALGFAKLPQNGLKTIHLSNKNLNLNSTINYYYFDAVKNYFGGIPREIFGKAGRFTIEPNGRVNYIQNKKISANNFGKLDFKIIQGDVNSEYARTEYKKERWYTQLNEVDFMRHLFHHGEFMVLKMQDTFNAETNDIEAVGSGNSGSPFLDVKGNLVGIFSNKASRVSNVSNIDLDDWSSVPDFEFESFLNFAKTETIRKLIARNLP